VSDTKPAFEQLTDCLEASLVEEWTKQERAAMKKRGDYLKIYEVASEKCKEIPLTLLRILITHVIQYPRRRKYA